MRASPGAFPSGSGGRAASGTTVPLGLEGLHVKQIELEEVPAAVVAELSLGAESQHPMRGYPQYNRGKSWRKSLHN